MTPCPDSYGEEEGHEEAVGEREPVNSLFAVPLQVDVPATTVFNLAFLESNRVCVHHLLWSVEHLRVEQQSFSHHVAIVALRHQFPIVNHVINTRRDNTHSYDTILVIVTVVVGHCEGQLA